MIHKLSVLRRIELSDQLQVGATMEHRPASRNFNPLRLSKLAISCITGLEARANRGSRSGCPTILLDLSPVPIHDAVRGRTIGDPTHFAKKLDQLVLLLIVAIRHR